MSRCKACGQEIIWIKTKAGKAMPCDPEQVVYYKKKGGSQKIVTPNGEVVSAELSGLPGTETGVGHTSHFASCPAAEQFRRR